MLIFNPNLDRKCCLEDKLLYEVNNSISMTVTKYPEENIDLRVGTAAYQAERDLDTLMYQDTGIYRNQQYLKANTVSLQTMYEEISILWDQELKYRPNFSVIDDHCKYAGYFFEDLWCERWHVVCLLERHKDLLTGRIPR